MKTPKLAVALVMLILASSTADNSLTSALSGNLILKEPSPPSQRNGVKNVKDKLSPSDKVF